MGRQRWGTKDHVVLVWSHVFVCVHICEYLCVPDRTGPRLEGVGRCVCVCK